MKNSSASPAAKLQAWQKRPQVQAQMQQEARAASSKSLIQGLGNQAFASPDAAAQDALIKFQQIQGMGAGASVQHYNNVVAQYQKAVQQGATPIPAIANWATSRQQQIAQDNKNSGFTNFMNVAVPLGLTALTGGALASAAGLGGFGAAVGGANAGTGASIMSGYGSSIPFGGSSLGLGSAESMWGLGNAASSGLGGWGAGLTGGASTALGGAGLSAMAGGAAGPSWFSGVMDWLGNIGISPADVVKSGSDSSVMDKITKMTGLGPSAIGSLISGAASLIGGSMGSDAAKNAAAIQAQAAQNAIAQMQPYARGGLNAFNAQQDLLGLGANGSAGQMNALKSSPGYQFRLQQGQQGLDAGLAARGGMGSGKSAVAAADYNQNFASQEYQNRLAQLSGVAGTGFNASSNIGSFQTGLGNVQGAAGIASSNAMQSGLLGAANALSGYLNPMPQNNQNRGRNNNPSQWNSIIGYDLNNNPMYNM